MRIAGILVSLSLLAGAFAVEDSELPDSAHPHGVRHVEHSFDGHHHGDADDHHESPDSPCHHHETQACFGHGVDLAGTALARLPEPELALRLTLFTIRPVDPPSLIQIFHIPI
jgi:hypothetical protein